MHQNLGAEAATDSAYTPAASSAVVRARQAFSDLQMMVYVRIPLEPGLESYIQVVPEQTILHHVSDDVNPAPNLKQITNS